jgi:hypothetical protein
MELISSPAPVITGLEVAASLPGRPLLVLGQVAGAVPACVVFERERTVPLERDAITRQLRSCVDRLAEYFHERGLDPDVAAVRWGAVLVDRTWRFRPVWSTPYGWFHGRLCADLELVANGEARLTELGLRQVAAHCGQAGEAVIEFARNAKLFAVTPPRERP